MNTNDMCLSDIEKESEIPNSVIGNSQCCGGYLDLEHTFFTTTGEPVESLDGDGWFVIGNYYGSAIFKIVDHKMERMVDFD